MSLWLLSSIQTDANIGAFDMPGNHIVQAEGRYIEYRDGILEAEHPEGIIFSGYQSGGMQVPVDIGADFGASNPQQMFYALFGAAFDAKLPMPSCDIHAMPSGNPAFLYANGPIGSFEAATRPVIKALLPGGYFFSGHGFVDLNSHLNATPTINSFEGKGISGLLANVDALSIFPEFVSESVSTASILQCNAPRPSVYIFSSASTPDEYKKYDLVYENKLQDAISSSVDAGYGEALVWKR